MFRRVLLVSSALLVITGCAKTPDLSADIAQIRTAEAQWFDLYNQGDSAGVANLYADNAMILAPGVAAASGKAAIRDFLANDIKGTKDARLNDKMGQFNGSGASGDLGWVSGGYILVDASGTTVDTGKYTTLFGRTNGEWKIIRDTWNSDTPPSQAATAAIPAPKAKP